MSWEDIIAAVLDAELPTSEKMTLLAIARHADDHGRCEISSAMIAYLSGLKRSTVFKCLSALEGKGLLSREERAGKSTVYTVNILEC